MSTILILKILFGLSILSCNSLPDSQQSSKSESISSNSTQKGFKYDVFSYAKVRKTTLGKTTKYYSIHTSTIEYAEAFVDELDRMFGKRIPSQQIGFQGYDEWYIPNLDSLFLDSLIVRCRVDEYHLSTEVPKYNTVDLSFFGANMEPRLVGIRNVAPLEMYFQNILNHIKKENGAK